VKSIVLGLLLCTGLAWGEVVSTQELVAECTRQMEAGVCLSRPDRTQIQPGQTLLISGAGRVSYAAYADYMDLFDPKNPNDAAMCQLALRYLSAEPHGEHAQVARALWTPLARATPVQSVAPETAGDIAWKIGKVILLATLAFAAFKASRKE
jgi:hypothetical protein